MDRSVHLDRSSNNNTRTSLRGRVSSGCLAAVGPFGGRRRPCRDPFLERFLSVVSDWKPVQAALAGILGVCRPARAFRVRSSFHRQHGTVLFDDVNRGRSIHCAHSGTGARKVGSPPQLAYFFSCSGLVIDGKGLGSRILRAKRSCFWRFAILSRRLKISSYSAL